MHLTCCLSCLHYHLLSRSLGILLAIIQVGGLSVVLPLLDNILFRCIARWPFWITGHCILENCLQGTSSPCPSLHILGMAPGTSRSATTTVYPTLSPMFWALTRCSVSPVQLVTRDHSSLLFGIRYPRSRAPQLHHWCCNNWSSGVSALNLLPLIRV